MNGLYQLLGKSQDMLTGCRYIMVASDSPQDAHDAKRREREIMAEIAKLKATIESDTRIISILRDAMLALGDPDMATAHRMLVLRHLEDCESRLLRELGDQPITGS